jgi:hypothetical protein
MDVKTDFDRVFYEKYLKYKYKYLELKAKAKKIL